MRTGRFARAIGVSSAVLLAVTACGSDDDNGGGDSSSSEEAVTNIYGSDGNMGSALGDQFTDQGALAGMKGTTPLTDLGQDFKDRLLEVDPDLQDYNYSAETYDAVVLSALASSPAIT